MLCRLLYYAIKDTQGSLLSNIIGNEKQNDKTTSTTVADIMTEVLNKIILIKLPFHRPSYLPGVLGDLLFGDNSRYIISCDDEDNESSSTSCCIYINGMMMTDLETIKNHKKNTT